MTSDPADDAGPGYAELQVTTHFSFLRGVASAEELFTAAANLGIGALGIVDRNSVAGMVRCWEAAKATGVRLVAGCRLDLVSGESLLVWPEDRAGWSRLTRLLSESRPLGPVDGRWQGKAACRIAWEDVARWGEGLVAALVADEADAAGAAALARTADIFGTRAHLAIACRRRPGDMARIAALDAQAQAAGVTPLATGDVLYASPDQRLLQDVVTAIREKTTIDDLGFRRERHADRHIKSAREMTRLFARWPHMLAAGRAIVARCRFDLGQIAYQYPSEATPGMSAHATLVGRVRAAEAARWPGGAPDDYRAMLDHELALIERLRYAPYFLTVNAIVAFARSRGILCQGRGSAANSLVCFLLGITSIDPIVHELLFERFVSGERDEPPDIDVDFEHERREEVIQWIYATYGQQRAALTAVVSRYRARGAVREVGKALGLPEDLTAALAGQVWGWSAEGVEDKHVENLSLDAADPRIALTLRLARDLIGTPRHLSQHPGGFVLAEDRLDDLVPIAPAAMDDRRVIEWDKDDIDALRFMKVDVLGLGMLGCMRRAFDLLTEHKDTRLDLASDELQQDCPETFAMIQRADTLGTFQIESRAQMSMLPRMKPDTFYDLVIQIAIVRPGPIQGDMVHPYLRRREGLETPEYPKPELEAVLSKTLGVPLFQEQAMKVAIVGAGFTPAEADALRRAMATFKLTGGVSRFHDKLIGGMVANGYTEAFAARTFKQIEGFGSYGFPESHAASFAKIAYASSWMKRWHPDIFCAALLNAQPMGFYAPAQIVRDAREHGVEVRPVCIARSGWDALLEGGMPSPASGRGRGPRGEAAWEGEGSDAATQESRHPRAGGDPCLSLAPPSPDMGPCLRRGDDPPLLPLRLGLHMAMGLSAEDGAAILAARAHAPFATIEDVWRRAGISTGALERLADADAFRCFGLDRRQAIWRVKGLGARQLPLFAAADLREQAREPMVRLTSMTAGRDVVEDYRATQLSLRRHPLAFLRAELGRRGVVAASMLRNIKDGRRVEVAGLILVRQKPGSAKGVLFVTIEDETGIANGILWPHRFEAQRRTVLSAAMLGIVGHVQRDGAGGPNGGKGGDVIHVIAERVVDYTPLLRSVGEMDFPYRPGPGDGATHGGSPDRGDPGWVPKPMSSYHRPFRDGADPEDVIRVKSHDFR